MAECPPNSPDQSDWKYFGDLEQSSLLQSNHYDHDTAQIEVCAGVGEVRATNFQELSTLHT